MPVRILTAAACVAMSALPCAALAFDTAHAHVRGIVLVALNPQPEPPGAADSKAGRVALNPQPEPPGKTFSRQVAVVEGAIKNRGERVALNPQPEPPGYPVLDARLHLPPGPCAGLVIRVEAPSAAPVTVNGTEIGNGKCGFDATVPGARAGDTAQETITRKH